MLTLFFGVTNSRSSQAQPRHPILEITVKNSAGDPVPCRIHLQDESGKPIHAFGYPAWNDHFVCDGMVGAEFPEGKYRYEIERGPEHQRRTGTVTVRSDAANRLNVTLPRIANLRELGWYSGDLHVHRPVKDIELLMRAEDLDFAPVITWWNRRNAWKDVANPEPTTVQFDGHRIYNVMAGEDEREGGALLYFGLKRPLDITSVDREVPSPMSFVTSARDIDPQVWIDIEKPFWWDAPVWIASSQMQSIGIANNHMCRSLMYENEAWGRPRDEDRLPAPRGNGFWTQEIYYHLLNAGIRIPPSAGSASGVLPNPVGYNRVYVHLGKEKFSRESWFEGLRQGRCFVTNGPLLIARADNKLPGHEFDTSDGKHLIQMEVRLTTLDRVSKLEVIRNGEIVKTVPCRDATGQDFRFGVEADGAGWFLVRAVTEVQETFRFASTAPWYFTTKAGQSPIRRQSASFFLDWTRDRISRLQKSVTDPDRIRDVIAPHHQAEAYWQQKLAQATAP